LLLLFQDGTDVTCGVQYPDDVDPTVNGPVEDQVVSKSSDAGATQPGQPGVGELIRRTDARRPSQSRKRRLGGLAEPVCGVRISFAD